MWVLICSYIWFMLAAVVTFSIVDKENSKNMSHVKNWLHNYRVGCEKELDYTYAL